MKKNPLFVAEFTTNHLGNLNLLFKMVEKAAESGCNFIKMQKKDIDTFYSAERLNSTYSSPYGKTYKEYRSMFEFSKEDFLRFDYRCRKQGIEWFSTVQDVPSLKFMLEFDRQLYKIASINSRNVQFLREVSKSVPKNKTIVISVAGGTLQEIENTINIFPDHRLYILHCVAQYPCKTNHLNLGNIKVLKKHFEDTRISIGYSGHEVGFQPSLAAVDMGGKMIERHFCLSRNSFVHHIECSLEPNELTEMINIVKSEDDLSSFYTRQLSETAFSTHFGMNSYEYAFLNNNGYSVTK